MTEQNMEVIIKALEEYGVPLLKLYTIISVIGVVVFLVIFVFAFVTIIRQMKKMDDDFDKRWMDR